MASEGSCAGPGLWRVLGCPSACLSVCLRWGCRETAGGSLAHIFPCDAGRCLSQLSLRILRPLPWTRSRVVWPPHSLSGFISVPVPLTRWPRPPPGSSHARQVLASGPLRLLFPPPGLSFPPFFQCSIQIPPTQGGFPGPPGMILALYVKPLRHLLRPALTLFI